MGTSTAGIAHAAIAAHILRPAHGLRALRRQGPRPSATSIEGKLEKGQKVVVVEDLISTGGSVIDVVDALREAGAEVLGIASIFTYGMKKGLERLAAAGRAEHQPVQLRRAGTAWRRRRAISSPETGGPARWLSATTPADESWMHRREEVEACTRHLLDIRDLSTQELDDLMDRGGGHYRKTRKQYAECLPWQEAGNAVFMSPAPARG